MMSIFKGHVAMVKLLCGKGVDLYIVDNVGILSYPNLIKYDSFDLWCILGWP